MIDIRCDSMSVYLVVSAGTGFDTYLAADAINKSVSAVNKSIAASTQNPNVTANVKVLIETVQKVCHISTPFH